MFSELFGTRVRYSGASLGSQLSSVIAGGLSAVIATSLLPRYGRAGLAMYVAGMSLVTITAVAVAAEAMHSNPQRRRMKRS
jgi:MFS transporter, MHS family, shikimate and dehydroshikimate transport protein